MTGYELTEAALTTEFYISTRSARPDDRARVLKYGKTFATFNRRGDIVTSAVSEEGIFHDGTRYLSQFKLLVGGYAPLLLSSTISADNLLFAGDLSNVDLWEQERIAIPRETLHLARTKYLWDSHCFERLRITNYGLNEIVIPLRFEIAADFADIFEVRGTSRENRGRDLPPEVGPDWIVLGYQGLDNITRRTRLQFEPKPTRCSASVVSYGLQLLPKQEITIHIQISLDEQDRSREWKLKSYDGELSVARKQIQQEHSDHFRIYSSNEQFNEWLTRSVADLEMMIRGNPERDYPYAGVPWYSTIFGRDGLITSLECLWLWPNLARGVLEFLAANQATQVDRERDAEPGKILHELRHGEMANLNEIPFGRYYGSIDSTPLFLMTAAAYFERTGDREFIAQLWPHLELALRWISDYGDLDGDGFVEYDRRSTAGLTQQGWKDSYDSVFHADGRLAEGPIALCEVQGYVYAAKCGMAKLARVMETISLAERAEREASDLQAKFEESFWCEDLGAYALALDGDKRPCRVRTSNAGQCLYTGIAHPENARAVGQTLLGPDFFSGWGIRTVGAQEIRYNPISYHNGSVWPHDNAMIASGLARYGMKELASRVFLGLLDLSVEVELRRLPELFCGLHRRNGEGPTLYPVACSPQAWAAGALFMLLQSVLGIQVDGEQRRILVEDPHLPETHPRLWVKNLKVGESRVDLYCERENGKTRIEAIDNRDGIEIIFGRHQPGTADSRLIAVEDRASST
jgi:glycogen debranching enzyme